MKRAVYFVLFLGVILLVSSCTFPHWFVSPRHISVDGAAGNALEIVEVRETMKRKSHFSLDHYFPSQTLNVSEKSFSVLYQGRLIQPKVWVCFPDKQLRLKKNTTIPPMTSLLISFNVKRKQGDTIHIVERDVLQINDSIIINVEIPEMYEECDSIDVQFKNDKYGQ